MYGTGHYLDLLRFFAVINSAYRYADGPVVSEEEVKGVTMSHLSDSLVELPTSLRYEEYSPL